MRPYIGITDFTSFEQVKKMLEVFSKYKHPRLKHFLHITLFLWKLRL
jgi:hypothetical protein